MKAKEQTKKEMGTYKVIKSKNKQMVRIKIFAPNLMTRCGRLPLKSLYRSHKTTVLECQGTWPTPGIFKL